MCIRDRPCWYYVENLKGAALVEKYRAETGIFAHACNLTRWLEAHKLLVFRNNEDVHTHECGEYVLQELQAGVSPEVVKDGLLKQYLVTSTTQRLVAYRRYREQRGDYWTCLACLYHSLVLVIPPAFIKMKSLY